MERIGISGGVQKAPRIQVCNWGYVEDPVATSFSSYHRWVAREWEGPLAYLKGERMEKRRDIRSFYPEFRSALVFLFSYAREQKSLGHFYGGPSSNGLRIAGYALGFGGRDYHKSLREELGRLGKGLAQTYPGLSYRCSLDVHPVLERDLAYRAGLGWFGKNSMLISRHSGSFFLIGALLLDRTLPYEVKPREVDHCGHCRRCVDSCPTGAIDPETRTLVASKCISTFTVEMFSGNKDIPAGMEKGRGEIFGCDICQDVCPWNGSRLNFENPGKMEIPGDSLLFSFFLTRRVGEIFESLAHMSKRAFRRLFRGTGLGRTGRDSVRASVGFWLKKAKV